MRWISCNMWLTGCAVDHKNLHALKSNPSSVIVVHILPPILDNVLFELINLWSLFSFMINYFILGISHPNSLEPLLSLNSTISANCWLASERLSLTSFLVFIYLFISSFFAFSMILLTILLVGRFCKPFCFVTSWVSMTQAQGMNSSLKDLSSKVANADVDN